MTTPDLVKDYLRLIPCPQNGGHAENILKYLDTTSTQCFGLLETQKIFKMTDDNKKKKGDAKYKAAGTYTVVIFVKELIDGQLIGNTLVLRINYYDAKYIDRVKEKYIADKKEISKHMIQVYYYGILINASALRKIASMNYYHLPYMLVKKYFTFNDLLTLNRNNILLKHDLMKQTLDLLILLNEKNIYHRDLKPENLGYDEKNILILIDWDETTLVKYSIGKHIHKSHLSGMTYIPYYYYYLYQKRISFNEIIYSKINCLALFFIFGYLFLQEPSTSFYKQIIDNVRYFISNVKQINDTKFYTYDYILEYFKHYEEFDSEIFYNIESAYKLDKLYFDIELKEKIMLPLLNKKYEEIPTYEKTLNEYKRINPDVKYYEHDIKSEHNFVTSNFKKDKVFYLNSIPNTHDLTLIKSSKDYIYYQVTQPNTYPYIYPNNIVSIYDKGILIL